MSIVSMKYNDNNKTIGYQVLAHHYAYRLLLGMVIFCSA